MISRKIRGAEKSRNFHTVKMKSIKRLITLKLAASSSPGEGQLNTEDGWAHVMWCRWCSPQKCCVRCCWWCWPGRRRRCWFIVATKKEASFKKKFFLVPIGCEKWDPCNSISYTAETFFWEQVFFLGKCFKNSNAWKLKKI